MDYRRWFDDSGMLYSYDLEDSPGRDHDTVVQIEKAWGGEVTGEKGRKSKKPILKFVGLEKCLALNKTNGKTIRKMYGKDGDKWPGCWITLYVTTVDYDGETRDCIRVRPQRPDAQRPAQNGRGQQRRTVDVEAMIASYDGCDDPEVFDALEADRKAAWGAIGKDDKLRVKAAADACKDRVCVAPKTQGELDAALKDQGLIDETHQDRVNRVTSETSGGDRS